MSLRGRTVEERATLPTGEEVIVRVGVLGDPYIARREIDTVTVELEHAGAHLAAVSTVLGPKHESEAVALAREIKAGLESGALEPTAAAIEPLADRMPAV